MFDNSFLADFVEFRANEPCENASSIGLSVES